MRNLWFALIVILVTAISASAETVFLENFSDGAGQFTGFQTSSCKWHTPGTASALIAYFGDDQYAEVVRSGCVLPVWNAAIESDAIDLTGYTGAELSFNHYFTQTGAISMGQASISLDGGETWQPVYTTDGTVTGEIQTIAIPQADGEPDVRIRFYFSYYGGALASSWGVDDVTVEASPLVDDDSVDDDVIDDDSIDDDVIDDDTADDDTADDDVTDDDAADDDAADDDAADDDTGDEETDIAYVYSVNLSRAEDFALFLNGEGYRVSLLQIAELDAAPDLAEIEVFFMDSDTTLDWTAERAALVLNTGKPIIGDGDGLSLLAYADGYLGANHFAGVVDQQAVEPAADAHPIWHEPYEVDQSDNGGPLPMLISPMTIRGLQNDGSNPAGVQFLGQCESYTDYYAVAVENIHYAVWAYAVMGPSMYTSAGQRLLVNLIEYVQSEPVDIGYVYAGDDVQALLFQQFLASVGYTVDLLEIGALGGKADLAKYELFMVDDNAGAEAWTEDKAKLLINSGKPIVANNGGVHVFDYTEQYLSAENCLELDPAVGFAPQSLDHAVWHDPFELGLDGSDFDVLAAAAAYLGLHDDASSPAGVEFLGRDLTYLSHYPLAIQDGKYALWAFGVQAPDAYSMPAQRLLVNVIEYLQAGEATDDDSADDDTDADDDDAAGDDDDDSGGCGC